MPYLSLHLSLSIYLSLFLSLISFLLYIVYRSLPLSPSSPCLSFYLCISIRLFYLYLALSAYPFHSLPNHSPFLIFLSTYFHLSLPIHLSFTSLFISFYRLCLYSPVYYLCALSLFTLCLLPSLSPYHSLPSRLSL